MAGVLRDTFPGALGEEAASVVDAAVGAMPNMPDDLPTFHNESNPLSALAHLYEQALLRGDRRRASGLVLEAVSRGHSVSDIYLQVFQPTQCEVGRLWQVDRIGVAQEHFCTAATQLVMSQLYPHLLAGPRTGRTLVATCVSGDQHELGVRMVADFFEIAGWDTFYTGANTPHKAVVDTVVARKADVLAISATIAFHLHEVTALIQAVRSHPQCAQVKILVGGYPFKANPELWRQVGADGRTDPMTGICNRRHFDAAAAIEIARAHRDGSALCAVMVDLDHFKSVNDRYGHGVGDDMLIAAAGALKGRSRSYDTVARYGGEEFVLLLPNTSLAEGVKCAERLRAAIEALVVATYPHRVTASLGVAQLAAGEDAEAVVGRADAALYTAKESGRNRVEAHTLPDPPAP